MSKRGVGTNGNNHQSFEQPFSEISAVELITELIKIELQELPLDSMVHISEYCFCIGYGRVHPRKHFVSFFGFNDTGFSFFHNLTYFHVCRGVVHDDFSGFFFTNVIHGLFYGVRPEVFYDDHTQMSGLAAFLPLLGNVNRLAFHHHKDFGLALAAVAPFERLVLFTLVLRGEMGFVQLCHAVELVTGVALPHDTTDFMHHLPNGLVTFVPKLALYFKESEQTPSLFYLSIDFDKEGRVWGAGGLFMQALPGCPDSTLEKLQEESGYPGIEAHKEQHQTFVKAVRELLDMLEEEEGPTDAFVEAVNKNITDWLLNHIQVQDKAVAAYVQSHNK